MKTLTAHKFHPVFVTLLASLFLVLAYNLTFWNRFIDASGGVNLYNLPLYVGSFVILVALANAMLTALAVRFAAKPVMIALFCVTAMVAYFMNHYGTVIDSTMVQNVFETNPREAKELFNASMLGYFLLLGVLPSVVVWRLKLAHPPLRRDLLTRSAVIVLSLLVAAGMTLALFKNLAPTFRSHRDLAFVLTPYNYLMATRSYLKRKLKKAPVVSPIGTDAVKGAFWGEHGRRSVTVIVLGETARAMNFSLNGYGRDTNPELSKQANLINFSNMQSCGTATAVSVPCLFSSLGRERYSDERARSQQGLIDVLSHAGLDVLWRNNNAGCKGVCDRVTYEDYSKPVAGHALCNDDGCYDERMLEGLPERIKSSKKDMVIVLHQLGSHGPTYWKRYPEAFRRFGPECATSDLQNCSSEAIIATYDNTILYTDHFVSQTINMLRRIEKEEKIDVSLMYFSDHGESLGENGMYLHGAPYMFAPIEQRHVPFMVWLPDSFRQRFRIDGVCLAARANQQYSHDNIFHSVLGMLNIKTAVRNPALDLFEACRQPGAKGAPA